MRSSRSPANAARTIASRSARAQLAKTASGVCRAPRDRVASSCWAHRVIGVGPVVAQARCSVPVIQLGGSGDIPLTSREIAAASAASPACPSAEGRSTSASASSVAGLVCRCTTAAACARRAIAASGTLGGEGSEERAASERVHSTRWRRGHRRARATRRRRYRIGCPILVQRMSVSGGNGRSLIWPSHGSSGLSAPADRARTSSTRTTVVRARSLAAPRPSIGCPWSSSGCRPS